MKIFFSILMILSMVVGFSAFQCSSTELTSAKLYLQQKNYDKAIEALQNEVAKNPNSDEGFYLLGYVMGEQGNVKGMLENFTKSSAISDKFASNVKESRRYHWTQGYNKGFTLFEKGAKVGGTDSAQVFFQKAVDNFNSAIMCEPDSANTYKNLVVTYLNMGKQEAAIEPCRKVVEITKSAKYYSQLGELLIQKGLKQTDDGDKEAGIKSYEEAISVLEEGQELYTEDGNILLLLSNAYIAAGKLEVAKEAFKTGVEKDPDNKFYRYNYGSLLLNANEYAEAAEHLSKAVEIDSEYENAIYNLAVTYVKWGANIRETDPEAESFKEKYELALPLLEKYLTIKEEESSIWNLLGKVYANLGMGKKSKEAFEKFDMYK